MCLYFNFIVYSVTFFACFNPSNDIILLCVSKVFTGIINNRIVCYCEENNVYEEEQNGFRKKRSCEDHIFTLTSMLINMMTV